MKRKTTFVRTLSFFLLRIHQLTRDSLKITMYWLHFSLTLHVVTSHTRYWKFSLNLFWWRHFDTNSSRLFKRFGSVSISSRIVSFSLRHRSHLPVDGLNGRHFFLIFQVIFGSSFSFFNLQTSFESSVSFSYFLWLANRKFLFKCGIGYANILFRDVIWIAWSYISFIHDVSRKAFI